MKSISAVLEQYAVADLPTEEPFRDLVRLLSYVGESQMALLHLFNGVGIFMDRELGFLPVPAVDSEALHRSLKPESFFKIETERSWFGVVNGLRQHWAIPLSSPDGVRLGVMVLGYSEPKSFSTEQTQALLAIGRRTQSELEQKSTNQGAKLSALGEMAAGIAHEINNPLAIIQGNLNKIRTLIELGKLDPKVILEATGKATKTVGRIVKIVSGLRAFARDGTGDPFQEVELNSIIDETLAFCQERFKNLDIQLQIVSAPVSPVLECRSVQISQVLLNLLANAFDAISESKKSGGGWIRLSTQADERFVRISVADSGSGITAEVRDKIFQPFFTTKPLGKGTGLGLSIAKGIVESHGGTLELDLESEHTRFVIEIPKRHS